MTENPTRAAMEATLNAYVERINAGDAAGVLALFAPGAVIEDPIGSPAKTGDDLPGWFADAAAFRTRITPVTPIRGSHGNEALLVFEVEFTPHGARRYFLDVVSDACHHAEFVDAFLLDHGRIHVGDEQALSAVGERHDGEIDRVML